MARILKPPRATLCEQAEQFLSRLRVESSSIGSSDVLRLASLLAAALSLANTVRNSYSPINTIPDDILILIFAHVPAPEDIARDWESSFVFVADLLPVTHVCRRWRAVALSVSSLWSSVCRVSARYQSTFLERAGSSLLVYHPTVTDNNQDSVLNVLEGHHLRIRDLRIATFVTPPSASASSPVFSALLRLPMPELTQVSIGDFFTVVPLNFSDTANNLLFNGCAPRLRKLGLHQMQGFPANQFDALTHLSFTPQYTATKLPDFLAFLSRCPHLQHVLVARLHFNPASHRTGSRVPLPHLRTLTFYQGVPLLEVNLLLDSLVLPQSVAIAIIVGYIEDIDNLCAIEPENLPCTTWNKVHFGLSYHELSLLAVSTDAAICVDPIPYPGLDITARVQKALHWLPLANIRELWIRIDSEVSYYPRVLALVECFPGITSLVLRIDGVRNDPNAREDCWDAVPTPVLRLHPGLECLRLCLWFGTIPPAVKGGLSLRAQTDGRLPRLVVETPQDRDAAVDMAELALGAEEVVVRRTGRCAWMEVPEVYRGRPHMQWREWPDRPEWTHPLKTKTALEPTRDCTDPDFGVFD